MAATESDGTDWGVFSAREIPFGSLFGTENDKKDESESENKYDFVIKLFRKL